MDYHDFRKPWEAIGPFSDRSTYQYHLVGYVSHCIPKKIPMIFPSYSHFGWITSILSIFAVKSLVWLNQKISIRIMLHPGCQPFTTK